MQDITKQQTIKIFRWKELAVNFLIAVIPGSVLIILLKQFAVIVGALPTLIIILGGTWIVGKIRDNKGKKATVRTVLIWVLINIAFFILLPALLLAFL
jgi:hypothetical protein